ncbi:MAG: helix-turn-helix transcriptional regulator [Clostridia bacterium]|nr:helix-turn-helix transcriptional regulator [Clostridia bacterium]
MKLHEKITVYRKKCGLSQETLAEKIGVSRQAVSKWETGDALPEITKLKSLADCFGVTVDFLLDENTDEYQPQNNVKTTVFDRLVNWISANFKTYSWMVGLALILIGVYITGIGIIEFLVVIGMRFLPIQILAVILSLVIIAFGVLLIVGGVIIIKKTKKKQ